MFRITPGKDLKTPNCNILLTAEKSQLRQHEMLIFILLSLLHIYIPTWQVSPLNINKHPLF